MLSRGVVYEFEFPAKTVPLITDWSVELVPMVTV